MFPFNTKELKRNLLKKKDVMDEETISEKVATGDELDSRKVEVSKQNTSFTIKMIMNGDSSAKIFSNDTEVVGKTEEWKVIGQKIWNMIVNKDESDHRKVDDFSDENNSTTKDVITDQWNGKLFSIKEKILR